MLRVNGTVLLWPPRRERVSTTNATSGKMVLSRTADRVSGPVISCEDAVLYAGLKWLVRNVLWVFQIHKGVRLEVYLTLLLQCKY